MRPIPLNIFSSARLRPRSRLKAPAKALCKDFSLKQLFYFREPPVTHSRPSPFSALCVVCFHCSLPPGCHWVCGALPRPPQARHGPTAWVLLRHSASFLSLESHCFRYCCAIVLLSNRTNGRFSNFDRTTCIANCAPLLSKFKIWIYFSKYIPGAKYRTSPAGSKWTSTVGPHIFPQLSSDAATVSGFN